MAKKTNKACDTTETKESDSSTKVNYPQNVFSGIRKTVGIKSDTGLYKEFKREAQAKMGSVCRPIECFMVAFLSLNKEAVNFGTTVKIENLHIERNLRSRRRLVITEELVAESTNEISEPCCDFRKCERRPVVATFRDLDAGVVKSVCSYHAKNLREHPKWREVPSVD